MVRGIFAEYVRVVREALQETSDAAAAQAAAAMPVIVSPPGHAVPSLRRSPDLLDAWVHGVVQVHVRVWQGRHSLLAIHLCTDTRDTESSSCCPYSRGLGYTKLVVISLTCLAGGVDAEAHKLSTSLRMQKLNSVTCCVGRLFPAMLQPWATIGAVHFLRLRCTLLATTQLAFRRPCQSSVQQTGRQSCSKA